MVSNGETRFAHTHILGGSGHGKTQLLQTLIHRDMTAGGSMAPSVVVIDSQGDLINTISHLSIFNPRTDHSLADDLLLIDPTDIAYPPAINLFDANMERVAQYGAIERERIFNGTIELYEYFFSALLGAGLSQKQNLIFRYLAELMLTIPGANIHTLRELLEAPEAFQDQIAKLEGTARLFFQEQFFDKSYDDTRVQVSRRLWGILANRSFERIFSSRTSRIDLFAAMNEGKIILINTAKDLLKQEGTAIFGRFFIALIAQAALERAQIPREKRRPTFVYIDEAQDYFDENIDHMLEQVRKYKIGLILAHQTLAQLSPKLKASIMANTGTKLVGGASAADATAMAKEMGSTPEFLQSMRKTKTTTSFALWIKGQTARPREVKVQLGAVDQLPRLSDEEYDELIASNRATYAVLPETEITWPRQDETDRQSNPQINQKDVTETAPDHRTLQATIRSFAQSHGFHVTVEKMLPDGRRIDLVLERSGLSIACEISCTTKPAHELENIRKCLAAGYKSVWSIAAADSQLEAMRALAAQVLSADEIAYVTFLTAKQIEVVFVELPKLANRQKTATVIGYDVRMHRLPVPEADLQFKRLRMRELLMRGTA